MPKTVLLVDVSNAVQRLWDNSGCEGNYVLLPPAIDRPDAAMKTVQTSSPDAVVIGQDVGQGVDGPTFAWRLRRQGYNGYIVVNGLTVQPFLKAGVVTIGSTKFKPAELKRLLDSNLKARPARMVSLAEYLLAGYKL